QYMLGQARPPTPPRALSTTCSRACTTPNTPLEGPDEVNILKQYIICGANNKNPVMYTYPGFSCFIDYLCTAAVRKLSCGEHHGEARVHRQESPLPLSGHRRDAPLEVQTRYLRLHAIHDPRRYRTHPGRPGQDQ